MDSSGDPSGPSDNVGRWDWLIKAAIIFTAVGVSIVLALIAWSLRPLPEVVTFREGSFLPASVEDREEYREAITTRNTELTYGQWGKNRQPAVFREEDIVQVWVDYCKHLPLPATVFVTMQSHQRDMTLTQYIARSSEAGISDADCDQAFLLTEQVRPGTVPGKYFLKITYQYNVEGRPKKYTFETSEFIVAPK